MREGMNHQRAAVDSGHWTLYRFDPRRSALGLNPLQLDSHSPRKPLRAYTELENRFTMLSLSQPRRASELLAASQKESQRRYVELERRAKSNGGDKEQTGKTEPGDALPTAMASKPGKCS
jgi:pyruvate-ferredoxin/flavodoxin oxidoreductase